MSGLIQIQGTSTDVGNGVVSVQIDSGPFVPASGTDNWTFAWDTATVSDGPHTIRARARQCFGCPAVFDTIAVVVQNGAGGGLSVDVTWPPNGTVLVDTVTMQGTASGAGSVAVQIDGGPPLPANGVESWDFVIEPGALAPGPHTLTAVASAGAQSASDSIQVTVQPPSPGVQSFVYTSSVDGEPMTSKLYLPPGFDTGGPPAALVVHLHGGGGKGNISPTMQTELDARGWIGIAPDGRFWDPVSYTHLTLPTIYPV